MQHAQKHAAFLLFCERPLNELYKLHNRNNQNSKDNGNAVFQKANGGKAEGICKEWYLDDQGGQQQTAQHSRPQNFIVGMQ